ncbi:hypothetical protein IC620_07265 [Hazenella sp. IB182357]|uniref:Uncharacterized protein n=1 Tax=Polycladospora coralii TaxID=2771432 RepID=A0A926NAQ3_9BACL|nr:hypothetical protein [Polycladospora coralii]MBD1372160.1 hypothetical protein [Polycladospora coralii]
MCIEYDEYNLLELFCSEPLIIDEEARIYRYETIDAVGFIFTLSFWGYEKNAFIRLEYQNLVNPIYDLQFKNVTRLKVDDEKLTIYQDEQAKVRVYFKPNFTLELL